MDALDLLPLSALAVERPLGNDADAWFMALDGQVIRTGSDVVIARITGIHAADGDVWIQLAVTEQDDMPGVVVQVQKHHSLQQVLDALATHDLSGGPLEIIRVDDCRHTRPELTAI